MPPSWGQISPKLLQRDHILEKQRTSHILNNCIQGRCLQAARKISKTAPKEPQFGDQEKQKKIYPRQILQAAEKYLKNCYKNAVWRSTEPLKCSNIFSREIPRSWREICPKLLQKDHSLKILRTSPIFKIISQGDSPKEPQFGDPENKPYIQKMYRREMPSSRGKISPKPLQKYSLKF